MLQAIKVLEDIDIGPGKGEQFTAKLTSADQSRWAGSVFASISARSEAQAKAILREWIANNVLVEAPYRSPAQRRDRMGVTVNPSKLSELRQSIATPSPEEGCI